MPKSERRKSEAKRKLEEASTSCKSFDFRTWTKVSKTAASENKTSGQVCAGPSQGQESVECVREDDRGINLLEIELTGPLNEDSEDGIETQKSLKAKQASSCVTGKGKPITFCKGYILRKAEIIKSFKWLEVTLPNSNGRQFGFCTYCNKNQQQALSLSGNKTLPIAFKPGVELKNLERFVYHNESDSHKASEEAWKMQQIFEQNGNKPTWLTHVKQEQLKTHCKIINIIMQVYNDLRVGTLSAWSYPSRHLTSLHATSQVQRFKESFGQSDLLPFKPFIPCPDEIRNLNPTKYREIASIIGKAEQDRLQKILEDSCTIGIQVDGSQDRMACDVKFVTIRVQSENNTDLVSKFLGIAEPSEAGAKGLFQAIEMCFNAVGQPLPLVAGKLTSITTDGEAANTGKIKGLWTLLREYLKKEIITIWCSCHRSDLALEAIEDEVPEVRLWKLELLSIAGYFRGAKARTKGLKRAAAPVKGSLQPADDDESDLEDEMTNSEDCTDANCFFDGKLNRFPKHFEVRMAEHFLRLVRSLLCNLQYCKKYFHQMLKPEYGLSSKEATLAKSYQQKCDSAQFVHFCCLMNDVLQIFNDLQKALQREYILVTEVRTYRDSAIIRLKHMVERAAPFGAEEAYLKKEGIEWASVDQIPTYLKGRCAKNKFVPFKRSFKVVRGEIVEAAITFLSSQLKDDLVLMELDSFIIATTATELTAAAAPFSDKYKICKQSKVYQEACILEANNNLPLDNKFTAILSDRSKFPEIMKIYRAIQCAAPHSMMVERCVSAYNKVKTADRSSVSSSTMQANLLVSLNGVGTAQFDPLPMLERYFAEKNRRSSQPKPESYTTQKFVQKFFNPLS